jgi:hypothetical protein
MHFPAAGKKVQLALVLALFALLGCQSGTGPRPVPSVAQIGGDLKCASGDTGLEDQQAGWGFCHPSSWRYIEKSQGSQSPDPVRLDLTFDITDISPTPVPCVTPSPVPSGGSPPPTCAPDAGLFAFMIISTYERGTSANLTAWVQENLHPPLTMQSISWGNAAEAGQLSDHRRIALTPHHVVIMDLRSGVGHLDLEAQMSSRLATWNFIY